MINVDQLYKEGEEIINEIKEIRKRILELKLKKMDLEKQQDSILLEVRRQIVFNKELKNDKQRDVAMKELLSEMHDYQNIISNMEQLDKEIAEAEIDLECYRHRLKLITSYLRSER